MEMRRCFFCILVRYVFVRLKCICSQSTLARHTLRIQLRSFGVMLMDYDDSEVDAVFVSCTQASDRSST